MAYCYENCPICPMKQTFSSSWQGSSQVRKQRKYVHNAPLHVRNKLLNARLSKDLRAKYRCRSITVRTGDEVLVMRGSSAKKKAKISSIDYKRGRIILEGITRAKKDGSKTPVFFRASVLSLISIGTDDKKRLKHRAHKKTELPQEAPHAPYKS